MTEVVKKALNSQKTVTVRNRVFGGDPLPYEYKNLLITFEKDGSPGILVAWEEQIIELRDDALVLVDTAESKRKAQNKNNLPILSTVFAGHWHLTYTNREGKGGSESVMIDSTGKYFANFEHTFNIRTVMFDDFQSKVSFNKVDLESKLFSKESLIRIDSDKWTGSDNKGYKLEYTRVKTQ